MEEAGSTDNTNFKLFRELTETQKLEWIIRNKKRHLL